MNILEGFGVKIILGLMGWDIFVFSIVCFKKLLEVLCVVGMKVKYLVMFDRSFGFLSNINLMMIEWCYN